MRTEHRAADRVCASRRVPAGCAEPDIHLLPQAVIGRVWPSQKIELGLPASLETNTRGPRGIAPGRPVPFAQGLAGRAPHPCAFWEEKGLRGGDLLFEDLLKGSFPAIHCEQ